MINHEGLLGYAINRARFSFAMLNEMIEAARIANIGNGEAEWKANAGIVTRPSDSAKRCGPQMPAQDSGPDLRLLPPLPDYPETIRPTAIDTPAMNIR